jgi:hypothetical protein
MISNPTDPSKTKTNGTAPKSTQVIGRPDGLTAPLPAPLPDQLPRSAEALVVAAVSNKALGPQSAGQRRLEALQRRIAAARAQAAQAHAVQANNGDDERYEDRRGSFTKGLLHDPLTGLAEPQGYEKLRNALRTGEPADFDAITLGGTRKLVNPQAGLAFDLQGADGHAMAAPPAPAFASDEMAAEIVENYWMALLRDVPFDEYESASSGPNEAQAAASELTALGAGFKGAKASVGGQEAVTPQTLFRGLTPGDQMGPYISQFLLLPVPFGAQSYDQRMLTPKPGIDFVTSWADYVEIQNGKEVLSGGKVAGFRVAGDNYAGDFDTTPRYIRNGRDLSQWVHIDVLFQAYFSAMLILLQGPDAPAPFNAGRPAAGPAPKGGFALNPGNPYNGSPTQAGFGTYGPPYIAATLCEVATRALKAVWYQKWFVHRRLRPEAFAARIHAHKAGAVAFDLAPTALNAPVLQKIKAHNKQLNGNEETYLLPQAFPEGSPLHPAYGAGHATVAGACVTVLKAFFDEDQKIGEIVKPQCVAADGTSLKEYTGADAGDLTVGGELNKLASNVAIGRNIAGVHWRSDGTESLKLGEQVAIAVLRDHSQMFNEPFTGYAFTKFNGEKVVL